MRFCFLTLACLTFSTALVLAADWQPAKGPLMTRWAKDVSPEKVHPEYPRPQMVRERWQNLNGLWDYAIRPRADQQPSQWDGQILVPFPIESALSGVMKRVSDQQRLWYRRQFEIDKAWQGQRLLLHFGAVDWETTVWLNGREVGKNRGGYHPFTIDVTDALKPEGKQELIVAVWDPSDKSYQPRGKQVQRPESIWYTPTTGIWQTVWVEPVSRTYIESLKITPDVDRKQVRLEVAVTPPLPANSPLFVQATVKVGDRQVPVRFEKEQARSESAIRLVATLPDNELKLWSPDEPFLYDLTVALNDGQPRRARELDSVQSYFGMRKIALGKDQHGVTRIMFNGQPLFQYGPLDQGFWPDGLYTAPTDEALKYDIEVTKKLGFNMARKHVKVEPARWYYWCDKLGLLVWQDMPSGDRYIRNDQPDIRRTPESTANFEHEWLSIIDAFYNHPSIVMWVPFNEGWGQFDTARIAELTKKHDPTRLVNSASGWTDRKVGDVHDVHVYPGPGAPPAEEKRAIVLGEFGGLGLPVRGHTWQDEKNWGYRSYTDAASLTDAYVSLLSRLHTLVGSPGLSAAVYTQTTDVEIEVNGLLTYDRAMIKPDAERITRAARKLYEPPPKVVPLVSTSQEPGVKWRYTTSRPAEAWNKPDFNDAEWKVSEGGFGTAGTPGGTIRTTWNTPDIWLRRDIVLPDRKLEEVMLMVHHDEDVEIYLNGVLAAEAKGYTTNYQPLSLTTAARAALKPGNNLLAVHCRQTGGGQYIDVGLVEAVPSEPLRAAAAAGKWESLFDGRTLGAWKSTTFGGEGEVSVEDGQIILPPGSELTGIHWSGALPRMNYEIALEAMRVDGSDFFCGLTFPVGPDPCSLIVGGWGGGVVGLSSLDLRDAANNDTTRYREFQKGRWYAVRLRVTKNKIEAWIDEEKMVDSDITGKKISIRPEVELSKPLGIASYSTRAALRNIRIRTIPESEIVEKD
jgi:hypothetical protein